MHAKMCYSTNDVHSGYLALSLILWRFFVRTEFIFAIGTRYGGHYHIDLDRFGRNAEMSYGAYEFQSECLALSYISCHDIAIWSLLPIGTRCGGKFYINSDGFEMHAELS